MGRTFQTTEVFPELTVRENMRIAVEIAAGFSLRLWDRRRDAARVRDGIDEVLGLTGLSAKADRLAGEAGAWRPTHGGDRHGAGAEARGCCCWTSRLRAWASRKPTRSPG
ncbi:MAG: hypothetical protein WDN49_10855 [Acetobacteraceae bacterium]